MLWIENVEHAKKTCGARKDGKMALQAEQQHSVNSAGTSLLTAIEKGKGLVPAGLASALQMNDAPRSVK